MSKLRQHVPPAEGDLETPPEGDLQPFVVFTQLKEDGPFLYAGWVDAADAAMAVQFGREHYGQDQRCTRLWAIPRTAIAGTEPGFEASPDQGPRRAFVVFTQKKAGDQYVSAGLVEAASSAEALEVGRGAHPDANIVWVAGRDDIAATDEHDLIWRYTDQTYRLARGYSAEVRDKWERIRAERDLREYEKDDLEEAF